MFSSLFFVLLLASSSFALSSHPHSIRSNHRRNLAARASTSCSSATLNDADSTEWSQWIQRGQQQCLGAAQPSLASLSSSDTLIFACSRLGYVSNNSYGAELALYSLPGQSDSSSSSSSMRRRRSKRSNSLQLSVQQAGLTLSSASSLSSSASSAPSNSPIAVYHYNLPLPSSFSSVNDSIDDLVVQKLSLVGAASASSTSVIYLSLDQLSTSDEAWTTRNSAPWGAFVRSQSPSNAIVDDQDCPANNNNLSASSTTVESNAVNSNNNNGNGNNSDGSSDSATASGANASATNADGSSAADASASAAGAVSSGANASAGAGASASSNDGSAGAAGSTATAASAQAASATPATASSATTSSASGSSDSGTQLSVLPIGLGVFGGVSALAIVIVGAVTYERRKFRKHFRERKMQEQIAASSGYGTAPGMTEARI